MILNLGLLDQLGADTTMDIHNHSGAPFVSVIYLLAEEQDQGGQLVMYDPRTNANRGFATELQHLFSPIEHTPQSGDVLILCQAMCTIQCKAV